jgi:hypothetical protein
MLVTQHTARLKHCVRNSLQLHAAAHTCSPHMLIYMCLFKTPGTMAAWPTPSPADAGAKCFKLTAPMQVCCEDAGCWESREPAPRQLSICCCCTVLLLLQPQHSKQHCHQVIASADVPLLCAVGRLAQHL